MKFSMATNFDEQVIYDCEKFSDSNNKIEYLYGKLKSDSYGGGRASMFLPKLTKQELKNYIYKCHEHGLKFNYLINPLCINNQDIKPKGHKKLMRYIEELVDMGIDAITINSPYLCEVINKRWPNLMITIGLYASIVDVQTIKYWGEIGAKELTLSHKFSRNFVMLEKAMRIAKAYNIGIRVIGNNTCLKNCPYKIAHGASQAHASINSGLGNTFNFDYYILKCNLEKITNPSELIAGNWIRPEDIHYFEELCEKVGYDDFSIKLVERTRKTDFLSRVIKAYTSRSYDGNLLKILNFPDSNDTIQSSMMPVYYDAITQRYNIKYMKKYGDLFNFPELYVDNKKLDGFFDNFYKNCNCEDKICMHTSKGTVASGVEYCQYCSNYAKKAVKSDKKAVDKWAKEVNQFLEDMRESKLFYSNAD